MEPGHAACKGATMKTSDVVKRYTCLSVSLFVNALGIALITHANLGTTPITTLPYTLAAIFGLTLGTTTFACNLIFLLLQRILLRRRLGIAELLQIPAVLIFSVFIDIWMHLTGALVTDVYVWQIVMCVVGSAVLGAGISLEIMSNATVIPGEGLVIVISTLSRKNFGNIKVLFDCSLVLASLLLGLAVLGSIVGLREGTVLSAVLPLLALDAQAEAPALVPPATPAPAPHQNGDAAPPEMTATAPPPGTMARRAIPRTAVPAMIAPGQPTALRGPDALPRTLRPSLPACRAMPPGVLPGHSRRGTRPLPTVPGTRKGLGPAGRALSAGQRQTHRHREPGHLSPVVPLRCPYPRLRHFAHAHRAGRPGSGRTLRKGRIRPGSGTVHSGGACAISGPFRRRRVRAPGNGRDGRPAPGKTLRQRPDGTGLPCAPPQDEPPFPALRQLPDARLTFQGGHADASAQGRFHRSGLRPRHAIPGRERPAPRARIRGGTAKQIFQPFRPEARLVQKISAPGARCRLRRRSGQPRQKQDRPAVGRPGRPGQIQAQQQGQQHAHDASPSFLPRRAACRGMRCAGTARPAAPHWRGPASMSRPAARHDGLPTGQGSGRTGGAAQAARHRGPRGRRQATRARRPVPDSRT